MAVQQDLSGVDDVGCALQIGVVAGQVVVKCGVWPSATSGRTCAGPARVKGETAAGEVVGQLGVEEVVGETVHQQHGMGRRGVRGVRLAATHQRGDEVALTVGIRAKANGLLPVTGQQVGLPGPHDSHLMWSAG